MNTPLKIKYNHDNSQWNFVNLYIGEMMVKNLFVKKMAAVTSDMRSFLGIWQTNTQGKVSDFIRWSKIECTYKYTILHPKLYKKYIEN